MPSYVEKKQPGIQPKNICPYPSNWDCICRQGSLCGAITLESPYPDTCDFYKPLDENGLFDVETLLINKCEACKQHDSCTNEKQCQLMTTLNYLELIRRKYVKKRSHERFSNKTSSGMTFIPERNTK